MNKLFTFIRNKGLNHWFLPHIIDNLLGRECRVDSGPQHIIFCFVDHYEPFNENVPLEKAQYRVKQWVERYPEMANRHKDAEHKPPQHTWFYPPHLDHCFLKNIVQLCKDGYGEIEMHLHHNHMLPFPDTEETLKSKIIKCIEDYAKHGIFCLPDGSKRFAFIHGDWSLANARGDSFCGVNDEIRILKECGCFADFTFPSLGEAQPSMINRIYYCKSSPDKPKCYDRGKEVRAGSKPWGDLLMIPGIIGFRWKSRTHQHKPSIEASNIDLTDYPFPARIDYWVKNAIRIKGRPEWLFIKLHTHAAREDAWDSVFGKKADEMYDYLEQKYNDGNKYCLHYVTAREMYNIVKACEAGMTGNPNLYRNYVVPRYTYLNK
jgi:hypothetical protein